MVDYRNQNEGYILWKGIWEPYLMSQMFYILNLVMFTWVYAYVHFMYFVLTLIKKELDYYYLVIYHINLTQIVKIKPNYKPIFSQDITV